MVASKQRHVGFASQCVPHGESSCRLTVLSPRHPATAGSHPSMGTHCLRLTFVFVALAVVGCGDSGDNRVDAGSTLAPPPPISPTTASPIAPADGSGKPALNAPCPTNLYDVPTWAPPPSGQVISGQIIRCQPTNSGGWTWRPSESSNPITRWLTYTSEKPDTFVGEVSDDPNILSEEDWVGIPQTPDAQCAAEQTPPYPSPWSTEALTAPTGQPLSFRTRSGLLDLKLKGYCLWLRVGS